ncbi:MAG: DUF4056 domain-containing protein [Prolixibacteraceae bacterium]
MYKIKLFLFIYCTLGAIMLQAKAPVTPDDIRLSKPHRVIRTCCSFGADMQFFAIPGIKLTEITSIDKIGRHHYLGNSEEQNGIIYTRRGGFIDMGHLRDQCDWLAYLYIQLEESRKKGILTLDIGHEGGEKKLTARIPSTLTHSDLLHLAGKIAYDLSVWHEIATWFGASTIPLIPERYSSFSVEDAFSNLLGVTIGFKSIQSELPYEEAVTKIIGETLTNLNVVTTEAETLMAMEEVRNIWWTREKRLPSGKVLIQRQLQVYPCLSPWLVPGWANPDQQPLELSVPEYTSDGKSLNEYYDLEFRLNHKFPFRKMFPERKERIITQKDFDCMLSQVATELRKKESLFQ